MSKGKLDPAFDGSGGGFGKFKGLTVGQVSDLFDDVSKEGNMRSVSMVLRIYKEQSQNRSELDVSSTAALVLGVATLVLLIFALLKQDAVRLLLLKATGIAAILFVGFSIGAITNRKEAKSARLQSRALADVALDALERIILIPEFQGRAKPLDFEQGVVLGRLLKTAKRKDSPAAQLLNG